MRNMRKPIKPSWLKNAARWGLCDIVEYIYHRGGATGDDIRRDVGYILTPARRKAMRERGIIVTGSRTKDMIYPGLHGRKIMEYGKGKER
mgnify:FL=1